VCSLDYMFYYYSLLKYKVSTFLTDCKPNFRYTKRKGKAVPLQAWIGPEGFRKLRFKDFMTTAQVVSLTHRPPLLPGFYIYYIILIV